ncbi:methylated-DNA--[protein]-cysteine S-methyltransferase [Algivirga pacifica]|uniref:Methylated-DNA--protein-cysteine methyltransferase n=1 Tax=Algivirga pacifica TaxID=1162670 RepID=A0ABP9DEB1_9BACT
MGINFFEDYRSWIEQSSLKFKSEQTIYITDLMSPIGSILIAATEEGICLLEFADRPTLDVELQKLQQKLKANIEVGDHRYLLQAQKELKEYFEGGRSNFEVPLHLIGTTFQQAVWDTLKDIPFGTTSTYLEQAKSLSKEKAVRAVASANGQNRILLLLPCHRIIGSNGNLAGYRGGVDRKKWLLDFERNTMKN